VRSAWAAYVAEVEVICGPAPPVIDFVAVQEVGKVLNPTLATGQVQGAWSRDRWALMEECKWRDGAMAKTSSPIPDPHFRRRAIGPVAFLGTPTARRRRRGRGWRAADRRAGALRS